jgi:hypothetical protein
MIVRTSVLMTIAAATLSVACVAEVDSTSLDRSQRAEQAVVSAEECVPDCAGRECGLDPVCGTSCGACGTGESCDDAIGVCEQVCVPDCSGRECGLDPVCGTSCGSCGSGSECDAEAGQCVAVCIPDCSGRTCGLDPKCGVSCGLCADGQACDAAGECKAPEPPKKHCNRKRGSGWGWGWGR